MRPPSSAAASVTHQATSSPRICDGTGCQSDQPCVLDLLTRGGAEFLAGRIVVPDLSGGRPQWLIGRRLDDNLPDDAPVHLGLPGAKPLLGLDDARNSPTVIVVEGSFD